MSVPKYFEFMLPILQFASDNKEHDLNEVRQHLSINFKLSEEDLNEMLPSGTQSTFHNRIGWAKTYLTKAGLLEKVGRSIFKISKRGLIVLKENPKIIDSDYLKKFDEFNEFQNSKNDKEEIYEDSNFIDSITPEESIEYAYEKIKNSLSQELVEKLMNVTSKKFELIVVDLLVKMGYGGSLKEAGQVVGKSGDEGIDGVIKEDKLGLDVIYVQAKKWDNVVGRPEIQKFAGALLGKKAKKGIFITTSGFTKDAKEYVLKIDANIILIDGMEMSKLMIEHNIGTALVNSYEIKKIDNDYFEL